MYEYAELAEGCVMGKHNVQRFEQQPAMVVLYPADFMYSTVYGLNLLLIVIY